jgi:hypothetical protein
MCGNLNCVVVVSVDDTVEFSACLVLNGTIAISEIHIFTKEKMDILYKNI